MLKTRDLSQETDWSVLLLDSNPEFLDTLQNYLECYFRRKLVVYAEINTGKVQDAIQSSTDAGLKLLAIVGDKQDLQEINTSLKILKIDYDKIFFLKSIAKKIEKKFVKLKREVRL